MAHSVPFQIVPTKQNLLHLNADVLVNTVRSNPSKYVPDSLTHQFIGHAGDSMLHELIICGSQKPLKFGEVYCGKPHGLRGQCKHVFHVCVYDGEFADNDFDVLYHNIIKMAIAVNARSVALPLVGATGVARGASRNGVLLRSPEMCSAESLLTAVINTFAERHTHPIYVDTVLLAIPNPSAFTHVSKWVQDIQPVLHEVAASRCSTTPAASTQAGYAHPRQPAIADAPMPTPTSSAQEAPSHVVETARVSNMRSVEAESNARAIENGSFKQNLSGPTTPVTCMQPFHQEQPGYPHQQLPPPNGGAARMPHVSTCEVVEDPDTVDVLPSQDPNAEVYDTSRSFGQPTPPSAPQKDTSSGVFEAQQPQQFSGLPSQPPREFYLPTEAYFEECFGFKESPSYGQTQQQLLDMVVASDQQQAVSSTMKFQRRDGSIIDAGDFKMYTLSELQATALKVAALAKPKIDPAKASVKFSNITGNVMKIISSSPDATNATFQVASQANCLEFANPAVTPEDGVSIYANDRTQGPACAMCCGAGTAYRNYFVPVRVENAPSGGNQQLGQTAAHQLNTFEAFNYTLAKLTNLPSLPFVINNGYPDILDMETLTAVTQTSLDSAALDELRANVGVGVQYGTEVTHCPSEAHKKVNQVFCCAIPIAYSGVLSLWHWEPLARRVLEGMYEATLFVAAITVANALRLGDQQLAAQRQRVYLTQIGAGAFGNDPQWVVDAVRHALERLNELGIPLEVHMVHFSPETIDLYVPLEKEWTQKMEGVAAARAKKLSAAAEKYPPRRQHYEHLPPQPPEKHQHAPPSTTTTNTPGSGTRSVRGGDGGGGGGGGGTSSSAKHKSTNEFVFTMQQQQPLPTHTTPTMLQPPPSHDSNGRHTTNHNNNGATNHSPGYFFDTSSPTLHNTGGALPATHGSNHNHNHSQNHQQQQQQRRLPAPTFTNQLLRAPSTASTQPVVVMTLNVLHHPFYTKYCKTRDVLQNHERLEMFQQFVIESVIDGAVDVLLLQEWSTADVPGIEEMLVQAGFHIHAPGDCAIGGAGCAVAYKASRFEVVDSGGAFPLEVPQKQYHQPQVASGTHNFSQHQYAKGNRSFNPAAAGGRSHAGVGGGGGGGRSAYQYSQPYNHPHQQAPLARRRPTGKELVLIGLRDRNTAKVSSPSTYYFGSMHVPFASDDTERHDCLLGGLQPVLERIHHSIVSGAMKKGGKRGGGGSPFPAVASSSAQFVFAGDFNADIQDHAQSMHATVGTNPLHRCFEQLGLRHQSPPLNTCLSSSGSGVRYDHFLFGGGAQPVASLELYPQTVAELVPHSGVLPSPERPLFFSDHAAVKATVAFQ